jgi:threonine/homoserine/homoserine lactone efflux protein
MPIETFLPFIIASALLSIAPGPDNIFVLTQSMLYGKRSGVLITLGLCTGLIFHTSIVALGVATLFQTSELAFTALKVAGAGYLLYLAWQAFNSQPQSLNSGSVLLPARALYLRGIIMNVSNPKVSIFFLAFLPQFASQLYGPIAPQIFLLGAVFGVIALVIFCCIAMLADRLGSWLRQSAKAQIYLHRLAGIVFVTLALNLLLAVQ